MDAFLKLCLTVCPLVFLAGFVDSVAGGGGVISLPAYLLAGLPAHFAAGTNKVVNGTGTLIAAVKYFRGGRISLRPALLAAAAALAGSAAGTSLAVFFSEKALKTLLLAALPTIAVFLIVKKDFGQSEAPARPLSSRREALLSIAAGFLIGCYDGLIGPGTGTLLIMAFTGFLSMDLLTASGCAKVVNLASNIAAATVWILNGQVLWNLALPAAACSILGNFLGARFALRGGSRRVRGMMFLVLGLLFLKMLYDLLF